jgi:hypothetical protein
MAETDRRRQRLIVRIALLILGAIGIAAGGYVLTVVPPTASSYYPKCISYQITGTHCPGCGTTRALHALLNGEVGQAFAYNALAIVAFPFLVVSLLRSLWFWLWDRPGRPIKFPHQLTWAIAIAFILFWILRNIPVYPLTLLAPHELTP